MSFRLTSLDPSFRVIVEPGKLYRNVASLDDPEHGPAQGVHFLCPKCAAEPEAITAGHYISCWFIGRGVPDAEDHGAQRFAVSGADLSSLSLGPAVRVLDGCAWRGFIILGNVTSAAT